MSTTISDHVIGCLEAFELVSAATASEGRGHSENASRQIGDKHSRFKVWSGSIGAHRQGKSSLDYRLRDASHLASQVKNLLVDLGTLLDTARSILDGSRLPWDQEIPGSDEEDNESIGCTEEDDIGFTTELDQISADIDEVVNCLMKLAASIRNPAPHDRFHGSIETDTSYYEQVDIAHVRAKCEHADSRLIKLLGKANSRRRQYFKYRESHHRKLTHGLDLNLDSGKSIVDTVASSIPSALKFKPLGFDDAVNADELSDSGFTQTSYAASTEISDRPRFPGMPAESANGPFQCPFCFMMITATTSYAWRKHIFADLRPYTCVAVDCPIAGTEFGRRRQWMEHMLQSHWRDWHCAFCEDRRFPSAVGLQNHLESEHANMVPKDELKAISELCERPRPFDKDTECPLCRRLIESIRQYRHHVGQHLEDIALFVLPRASEDNGLSDEENSKDGIEQGSSYSGSEFARRVNSEGDIEWDEAIPQLGANDSGEDNWEDKAAGSETAQAPKFIYNYLKRPASNPISDYDSGDDHMQVAQHHRPHSHSSSSSHRGYQPEERWSLQIEVHKVLERINKHDKLMLEEKENEGRQSELEPVPKNYEMEIANRRVDEMEMKMERSEGSQGGLDREENEHHVKQELANTRQPATTRVMRSGNEDDDITITLHGDGVVKFNDTESSSKDGGKINIPRGEGSNNEGPAGTKAEGSDGVLAKNQSLTRAHLTAAFPDIPIEAPVQSSGVPSTAGERENLENPLRELKRERESRKGGMTPEERDRELAYEHHVKEQLRESGLSEEQISAVLDKWNIGITKQKNDDKDTKPTYTRMARRHLSLETLRVYNVDYQLDSDLDYVLIKRWVPEPEQNKLWGHTRMIREQRAGKPVLVTEGQSKHKNLTVPKPTYTRMARRHLSLETLRVYNVDYQLDSVDPDFVLIKRWVPEPEQDKLWSHTRMIRERRVSQDGNLRPITRPDHARHLSGSSLHSAATPFPDQVEDKLDQLIGENK